MTPDNRFPVYTYDDGSFRVVSEWGCYPIMHVTADDGCLCGTCANENAEQCKDPDDRQWYVVASDTAEGSSLTCDHCHKPFDYDAHAAMLAEQDDAA